MKKIYFVLVVIVLLINGCTLTFDPDVEKKEIIDVLEKMKQAMTSENVESFSSLVAHDSDMVNFGTDATERWVGWDALKTSLEQQFDAFDNIRMAVQDQVIKLSECGKVAWFSQIVDWNLETGGQSVSLKGLRVTGVLEKRSGKWLFVQLHFSAGVSGQAAEY